MSEAASEWPAVAAVARVHCNNKGPGLSFQPHIHHTLALTQREKESERTTASAGCVDLFYVWPLIWPLLSPACWKRSGWLALLLLHFSETWNVCVEFWQGDGDAANSLLTLQRERLLLLQEALPRALFSTGPFLLPDPGRGIWHAVSKSIV